MSDWTWEPDPGDLLDGLPRAARQELDQVAREITVRDSVLYLDGKNWDGPTPGLRTETRDRLLVTYLTDVRGERVVIVQVTWIG